MISLLVDNLTYFNSLNTINYAIFTHLACPCPLETYLYLITTHLLHFYVISNLGIITFSSLCQIIDINCKWLVSNLCGPLPSNWPPIYKDMLIPTLYSQPASSILCSSLCIESLSSPQLDVSSKKSGRLVKHDFLL